MKKIAYSLSALTLVILMAYSIAWFVIADIINEEVRTLIIDARQHNIIIEGTPPTVEGFPGLFRLSYSGQIVTDDAVIEIPLLTIKGLPLPDKDLTITLPEGFDLKTSVQQNIDFMSPDYLKIVGPVPENLPAALTVEDLRKWRNNGGLLHARYFEIHKNPLQVSGQLTLQLDENLQPAATIPARVTGHMTFMGILQDRGFIDTKTMLLAGSLLGGLTREDPDTGARYLDADIRIQNRTVLLGPLELLSMPRITWPYRDAAPKNPGL